VPWTLHSAEERAAEAPRSFFIPAAELRRSLSVGDTVKLIFHLERDDGEVAVERMWVETVETDPYVGLLRNEPHLGGVIAYGDRVPFAAEHVCGYAYSAAELGYDPDTPCFLLQRVAEAEDPPALLLRTEGGDWEAHAREETPAELEDADRVLAWTLGYLTDRFPQTEAPVREASADDDEAETWWEWQAGRDVRVDDR
jgi:uncharacterized protein YegJ (DUF2314 family)